MMVATFGSSMALIVPMAFSLALRVDELAPGREEVLGYLIGIGSVVSLLANPLVGTVSDRTRSRFGRRRPYLLAGSLVGTVGTAVMAWSATVPILGLGWVLTTVGWGTALGAISNVQADRLPRSQRGRVSGLTGVTTQTAPVLGVLLAGAVSSNQVLLFALPCVAGTALVLPYLLGVRETDSRGPAPADRLTVGRLLRSYGFDPRAHRDFAWNWLGRFLFFLGLSMTTTFATFFYAQRLDVDIPGVAGFLAVTAACGVLTALAGGLGGGFLSDRLGRRRVFVFLAGGVFASGAVVSAFADSYVLLLTGSLLASLSIAAFAAVDQAIVLDVLPHRDTQAGRYMAVVGFSQKIPSAVGPLVAPLVISLNASSEGGNYTLLYLTAGALGLVGATLIALRVRSVR
ncbi:MFS transporter [Modestobacter roseus]|uniref:Na+/melibiose symporter-like transporter n=1 Tax=Modestobacter roseus TaxID=1181884 RepID=A0A562IMY8_9ACTN|nr:MFS transporter [Modestobacter roseus]MQA33754.1 MFS transporter [Modestobacter roseus]TWH72063.1 Na+/melibiose symporter-like transporter [Modestobacter roseus]